MTEKTTAQVKKMKELKDGWDGPWPDGNGGQHEGSAKAPSPEAITSLEAFLSGLELAALHNGGIEAETTAGKWTMRLTFAADGEVQILYGEGV